MIENKAKWLFRHRVKAVKRVLQIKDLQKEPKPGLTMLSKPKADRKKIKTLPPVYATVGGFERYQAFFDDDNTDAKLPTLSGST